MRNKLYGAILGDLAGQPYEFQPNGYDKPFNIHNPDSHITDDSILTLAGASAILFEIPLDTSYRNFGNAYPDCGFGKGFVEWLKTKRGTIGDSYGNGCLMRLSPFMYVPDSLRLCIESVMTSHCHEESLQSVIRLYNLYKGVYPDKVTKPTKFRSFSSKAIHSIEFCESVFMYAKSTHEAIRMAVKMGGDTDTHASIVGELCSYVYNDLTTEDVEYVESKLNALQLGTLKSFNERKL